MQKRAICILSLFAFSLLMMKSHLFVVRSIDYSVHNLSTGLSYATIQEAIDAQETLDGHTIFVDEGNYFENVDLDKPNLTLMGENKFTTMIDGNGTDIVVSLSANNSKIMGFTVKNGHSFGILMRPWTEGHVIRDNIITNNHYGLSGHFDCADIKILENIITFNNVTGLLMEFSSSVVRGNLISDNGKNEFQEYGSGIQVAVGYLPGNGDYSYCVDNTVVGNTIKNHQVGLWITGYSEQNLFVHNNFVNNKNQLLLPASPWNNTIVENYWSNYNGMDMNNDGIGEIPHVVKADVMDENPLMGMFSSFMTSTGNYVNIISNSTLRNFQYFDGNGTIMLRVSNSSETQIYGFCRVVIPHVLMSDPFNVTVNGANPLYWNYDLYDNGSHRWIYFEYNHSTLEIMITPDLLPSSVLILIIITISQIILLYTKLKRNWSGLV